MKWDSEVFLQVVEFSRILIVKVKLGISCASNL